MQEQSRINGRQKVRQVILGALLFMMVGTAMELYLLEHYEDNLQLIPILCVGASMLMVVILAFRSTATIKWLFKTILALTAISGFYGIWLHLEANYEFELEMKPGAEGLDLFLASLSGALPSLAPGSMVVMALLGYSYLILLNQKK